MSSPSARITQGGARRSDTLSLMIGLLIVQIIVVYLWGVEPRNRPLEDVSAATAPIPV
jgi:hypothetical protein